MPNRPTIEETKPLIDRLDGFLAEAGRTRSDIGIESRIAYGEGNPDVWTTLLREWQTVGATHCSFNTMKHGFSTPAEHIAAIRRIAEAVEPSTQ